MRLIDDSPGLFFLLVNCVVYAVIGVEILMIGSPTVATVSLTMALIASIAIGIGLWMHRLLEEESTMVPARKPVEEPAAEVVVERRPVARPALPRVVAH